jgi:TRAP-type transport system periplasmic protein
VFQQFGERLRTYSGGRLRARLYGGGVAGDERDVIRKMRIGQLEGAALSSVGLGQLVRSVLVLQVPGLFSSREQVARVRRALAADFARQFESAGFILLGWGDVGDRRMFSKQRITRPSDLKTARPWVWREDPIGPELLSIIGANGVPLALPEVMAALQTDMVDTVTATALAAVGLQWFRFVKYMSKSTGEPVVGATVVRKAWFDALPHDSQQALERASSEVESALAQQVLREDERAAKVLVQRGIIEVDLMQRRDEWEPVVTELGKRLSGRLFSRELLEKVIAAREEQPPTTP